MYWPASIINHVNIASILLYSTIHKFKKPLLYTCAQYSFEFLDFRKNSGYNIDNNNIFKLIRGDYLEYYSQFGSTRAGWIRYI